jgi:hypothetical protein
MTNNITTGEHGQHRICIALTTFATIGGKDEDSLTPNPSCRDYTNLCRSIEVHTPSRLAKQSKASTQRWTRRIWPSLTMWRLSFLLRRICRDSRPCYTTTRRLRSAPLTIHDILILGDSCLRHPRLGSSIVAAKFLTRLFASSSESAYSTRRRGLTAHEAIFQQGE